MEQKILWEQVNKKRLHIGYMGTFTHQKDIVFLQEVFEILQGHKDIDYEFIMIGGTRAESDY